MNALPRKLNARGTVHAVMMLLAWCTRSIRKSFMGLDKEPGDINSFCEELDAEDIR